MRAPCAWQIAQASASAAKYFALPWSTPPRIDHIAYTIENWDKNAVKAELERRGLNPQPDTENSFHIKDPNGFDLQISGKEMKPA